MAGNDEGEDKVRLNWGTEQESCGRSVGDRRIEGWKEGKKNGATIAGDTVGSIN
jgi:hypothetical protein